MNQVEMARVTWHTAIPCTFTNGEGTQGTSAGATLSGMTLGCWPCPRGKTCDKDEQNFCRTTPVEEGFKEHVP